MTSKWNSRYSKEERHSLLGERITYRMLRGDHRIPDYFSFRDYMRERLDLIGYRTWSERMMGRRVDIRLVHTALTIERWLGSGEPDKRNLSRDEWICVNSTISIRSVEAVIDGRPEILSCGWNLARVGSVWHEDEEYHVFVPGDVLAQARMSSIEAQDSDLYTVSPVYVFRRHGDSIVPVSQPEVMDKAAVNFRNMIGKIAHGKNIR